ncbi:MAG: DNA-binding domain-containing protein [Verrucomicrobiota bacterium]
MPEKTSLSDFQSALSQAVMRPLAAGDLMGRENRATANEFIKPNDRLTSADRLQIYNQQYWWRLLGSFAEDFRGLRAVLGERKFNKLATNYLTKIGSRSWNLRDLGTHLESYLRDHPELIAPHGPLATEMVRVEWARVLAFDGEPEPLLDAEKFARRKPAKMTLGLQPYITLLELRFPIDHLLKRLKRSESDSASNAMSGGLRARRARLASKPLPQPIHLAIHRLDLLVYYKRLDPEAYFLLSALRDGKPLESACEIAFSDSADAPEIISEKVRTWFAAWMSFGWLCE